MKNVASELCPVMLLFADDIMLNSDTIVEFTQSRIIRLFILGMPRDPILLGSVTNMQAKSHDTI